MDGDVEALVGAIDRSFDVKFKADELSDETYYADLLRVLSLHLASQHAPERCFTAAVFWRLRKACVSLFGLPKSSITPSTPIELIIPKIWRLRAWMALAKASGLRLPGLEFSRGFGMLILFASGTASLIPPMALGGGFWLASIIVLWPISATLLFRLLKPFADVFPYHFQTVADLAKAAVGLNYGHLTREFGPSREKEILEALRYVIADQIDIDPNLLLRENPRLIDLALTNDGFRAQV